jgi:DNA-binding response OmpR family regulator
VLVVEDERRLAANVARGLRENAGYAVDLAHDGEEGWFMAEANPYDLIILDLMIPAIDGLEIVRRLRAAGRQATPAKARAWWSSCRSRPGANCRITPQRGR